MPRPAQEWYEQVRTRIDERGYREPAWPGWPTWPFDGELRQRELEPARDEPPRGGAGGVDCFMCTAETTDDPDYLVWRDDIAMIGVPKDAPSIPLVAFLMPRRHADLADLTEREAGHIGGLLAHLERATCDVLDVPRLQVIRYGDGQEHLHWWLLARPTGALQLRGSFLALWDDLLPPMGRPELRAILDLVCGRLVELAGGGLLTAPSGG